MPDIGIPGVTGGIATDSNSDLDAATKLYASKTTLTGQVFDTGRVSVGEIIEIKRRNKVADFKGFLVLDTIDQGDYLEFDVATAKLGTLKTLGTAEYSVSLLPPIQGDSERFTMPNPTTASDPGTVIALQDTPFIPNAQAVFFLPQTQGAGHALVCQYDLLCSISIDVDYDLIIGGNNQEAGASLNPTWSASAGGIGDISDGLPSPRSGIFFKTGYKEGIFYFQAGEQIYWTAFEDFATGSSSVSFEKVSVVVKNIIVLDAASPAADPAP